MSTPQDPARRAKLKKMRTRKLAEWRAKKAAAAEKAPAASKPAKK